MVKQPLYFHLPVQQVPLPLLAMKTDILKMQLFGEKVGMAFQIKDDLFDYGNKDVGKPTGNDIQEKKLTLPLIYTLNNVDASLRRKLIYIVKNENKDKQKVRFVIDTVQQSVVLSTLPKKCLLSAMKLWQFCTNFRKAK